MMHRWMVASLVAACVSLACADEYWIAWEGETYPEEDGWERTVYGGGAERWFEEGSLVLDGRASIDIVDDYWIQRPLDPGPAELFVMEWRLRVDEVQGFADPAVAVWSYGHGEVMLWYTEDSVYSALESVWIDFAPGGFHEYSFTSGDMVTYSLQIDGQLAHVGQFVGPAYSSGIGWGDATQGAASLSVWDHVRFGVVPEPSAGLLLGSAGLAGLTRRIQA